MDSWENNGAGPPSVEYEKHKSSTLTLLDSVTFTNSPSGQCVNVFMFTTDYNSPQVLLFQMPYLHPSASA